MSSIHYKFRSLVSYKTINFETLHVSVEELKRAIFDAESLSPETFDLIIENSHTKREYAGKDIIPRNSSLIVKRVPRQDAAKLPKIQDTSTSGIVSKTGPIASDLGFINTEEFSKMTEEQRLEHVKNVSYQKYQPSNYQKKLKYTSMTDPPPPTYTCNRCNRTGHWVKNCPLATVRKTTGLPMDELVETTADDPAAMLHPATGKYMIQKMHLQARLNSKAKAPLPFVRDSEAKTASSKDENEKPKIQEKPSAGIDLALLCPICNELISEAVVMTCCGSSFCAECIQNLIIEDPGRKCPGDGCNQTLSVDAMIRNVSLRKAVENFQKKQQGLDSRLNLAAQSPSKIEKSTVPQKIAPASQAQTKVNPVPLVPIVDLSKPPPTLSNNPVVVLPDMSKPPPSFPIYHQQQTPNIPHSTTNTTTSNSLFAPGTKKSASPQNSASQSPNIESVPYEDQECATPPHVETPPHVPTPPRANPNFTLPPGAGSLQKGESPRQPELSLEAIQAFSAFNPTTGIDLLSKLNDDLAPPGVDDAPSIFQPVSTIDPVTGQLRGSNGRLRESKDRRSPVSGYRRRRRDSRSPVHRTKRRSPSPYRRPTASRRERPRREKTPPRKKHESSKRRRNSNDYSRSEKRKKRRSRTKSQELLPEKIELIADNVSEEEVAIDTVLKEITENLLPIKESQSSDDTVEKANSSQKEEKMEEVDRLIKEKSSKKSPKSADKSKSPDTVSKTLTRKSSANSISSSSNEKPAAVADHGNQISMDLVDEEMLKEEDPMLKMSERDELMSPTKEKVSRKSSGEKKAKKHKKDKKRKDKKHKKHKDRDESKSKSKKSKKDKKEKSKKHRSRSDSGSWHRKSRSRS